MVVFFIIDVTFDLTQVFVTLLLIFFDIGNVTVSGGSIGIPALLAITVQTKIVFGLTQSLPLLDFISTITFVNK